MKIMNLVWGLQRPPIVDQKTSSDKLTLILIIKGRTIWYLGRGLEFYLLANILFFFRHCNKQIFFAVAADKQFFFLKPKNNFFFVIPFLIYFRDIKLEIKLRSNAIYDSDNKSTNYLFSKKLDKDWENLSAGHFVNKILKNIKK